MFYVCLRVCLLLDFVKTIMSGVAQQNKSAITLKGSAEILCEYLGKDFGAFVRLGCVLMLHVLHVLQTTELIPFSSNEVFIPLNNSKQPRTMD